MISDLYSKLKGLKISIESVDGKLDIQAPEGVLNHELLTEIKDHKDDLINFINTYKKKKKIHDPISRTTEQPDYVLSSSQRRLWLLSQLEEGSRAYHISGELELLGDYSSK